ncbi:lipase family protein [Longimicrobium sp.]|uniref:lipase family protein n=1 Tax=Longimicrobium sp. TaxID=2029185 RepID=UPI002D7FA040|nr:lipase family protein [Longimicrobium sp.]
MTLAGLAYGFPEKLPDYLRDAKLATRGEWTATWVPGREEDGYFAFVAANARAKRFVVAIRGTNPSLTKGFLHDVLDDVDVGIAAPWAHQSVKDARIARGTSRGLGKLLALDAHGVTLLEHLDASLTEGAELWVTGHSLGGCLASVLALKLAERYAPRGVRVELMTFAAPSAGNAAFARLVQDTLPTARRYYNSRDLVPMAWHDIARLPQMYDAPGPRCSPALSLWARVAAPKAAQLGYTQPGPGTALPAAPSSVRRAAGILSRFLPFLRRKIFEVEALYQHDPNTYLSLLDAPKLPFNLPLPWLARDLGFAGLLVR